MILLCPLNIMFMPKLWRPQMMLITTKECHRFPFTYLLSSFPMEKVLRGKKKKGKKNWLGISITCKFNL